MNGRPHASWLPGGGTRRGPPPPRRRGRQPRARGPGPPPPDGPGPTVPPGGPRPGWRPAAGGRRPFEGVEIGLTGDHEPRGNGQAAGRQLAQVGALAPDRRRVGQADALEPANRFHVALPLSADAHSAACVDAPPPPSMPVGPKVPCQPGVDDRHDLVVDLGPSTPARAGKPDPTLELLRIAARIDLDDLTGTTAGGLHLAAVGGVWQALARGFLGLRAEGAPWWLIRTYPRRGRRWVHVPLRRSPRHRAGRARPAHRHVRCPAGGENRRPGSSTL